MRNGRRGTDCSRPGLGGLFAVEPRLSGRSGLQAAALRPKSEALKLAFDKSKVFGYLARLAHPDVARREGPRHRRRLNPAAAMAPRCHPDDV
jgi:hypothetical protein